MFTGTYTAIVTPFKNGAIDEGAFRKLIDFQIQNGVDGIVPVGSTGEAATLDHNEHLQVVKIAVEQAAKRCKIVAGTGSNSTREAIDLSVGAAALGVDGILLASPYYNKPTQEGMYRHFKAISEQAEGTGDAVQRAEPHCQRDCGRNLRSPGARMPEYRVD